MDNPVVYIIINSELRMSAGKAAAQAVHAAMMIRDYTENFLDSYKRTVIVLESKDAQQLENLWEYLDNAGIHSEYYIDEGRNEIDAYSITALAVEPIAHDDTEKREIFESFRLFTEFNWNSLYETPEYNYSNAWRYLTYIKENNRGKIPHHVKKTMDWLYKEKNK